MFYYLAEKIGINRLYALVVALRGEPEACEDTISRQAAISHVDDVPYIKEHPDVGLLWKAWIESLPAAQPELIEKTAYIRGFEQGRTQGMIDSQGGRKGKRMSDDLISRQAAIDALAELARDRFTLQDVYQVYLDALKDADMRIRQLPSAQQEQRWIPCSERLPEKDTCFYLATIANHGLNFITTLPDDVDVVRWDYDRRKGHNSWHWCTERTVIAWMPLPEPYQAERREE